MYGKSTTTRCETPSRPVVEVVSKSSALVPYPGNAPALGEAQLAWFGANQKAICTPPQSQVATLCPRSGVARATAKAA